MLRFFALMMMCVMLLSHGTASVAAPHGAEPATGHTHHAEAADADAADRHDADQSGTAGDSSDQDIDLDVAHGHPAADKAHTGGLLPARLAMLDVRDPPGNDLPLTPVQSAPLLEPPTA
ncbi:MAG: hypothetical protein LH466_00610 [Sphingomonas bacterium]|nr:hypothetical protein [Sphingomonas bacterium]